MEVGVDVVARIDIPDCMLMPNVVERLEQVEEGLQDIYDHVIKIPLQRIEDIETGQRELESRSLIAGGERASLLEQVVSLERSNTRLRGTMMMERARADRQSKNSLTDEWRKRWLLMKRPMLQMLSRRKIKAKAVVMAIMEMVEMEMVEMEMVEMEIQMRIIGMNNDLAAYTQRFQELTMMCTKMVPEEEDQVEKFIRGLPDNIQGNGYALKNAEKKRRLEVNQRDNRGQQPPFKRPNVRGQNVARAYTAGNNERKLYNGSLPLCNKCKIHHEGPCTVRCGKCNKLGHLTRDCKVTNSTTFTQRGQEVNQMVVTCFECGRQGHYMSDCPKRKDQNRGNKAGNKNGIGEAKGKAYVLGGGDANPDSNVVKGTFLLNNHYDSMIFDSGADRSFVSTTFSTLLDVTPDTLDVSYVVKLADERISETNTVLRGCTLGLLGHPFNIYLMLVELDEVLIVQGDRDDKGEKLKLSIISSTKTQKYIKRGCLIFLAQVTKKETEDKSKEKRLEDMLTVRDFSEVFPEDLPGLPPTRQVEFQIDLVPSVAPVAHAPYR
ncbi:reverse transcriptase domain-containing protein [Tanacetum coccineum]